VAGPASASLTVTGLVPARVVALTRGVLTAMRWNALSKMMLVVFPAAALAAGGVAARPGDGPTPIPSSVDPPQVAEAPSLASPAPDPGPGPNEAAPTPVEVTGVVRYVQEPESFDELLDELLDNENLSEYPIPEDFDIESYLKQSQEGSDQEVARLFQEATAEVDTELSEMKEQRTQIAKAMDKTLHAFEAFRARRDALKALTADTRTPPSDGEINSDMIAQTIKNEEQMLATFEGVIQDLGGAIRALESRDRALELVIRRKEALREALSGTTPLPMPTTGPATILPNPPALDPMARPASTPPVLSSPGPAPADPRDRRIDALERKLDAVLEALRARDR
jgi:ABC-type transporter Mla subunit MlaD